MKLSERSIPSPPSASASPVIPEQHARGCDCQLGVAEWYQEFAPVLLRYSLRTTGDVHAAEDCTHETFVRACARRHLFRCLGKGVRPWLFTIARNVALDYRKAHRREILTADPLDRVDYGPSPEECVTIREDAGEVRLLIGMLPPDQADCVVLRFFEDRSVVETAEALGRRGVAVRALQYRALRNLRDKLTTVEHEWS